MSPETAVFHSFALRVDTAAYRAEIDGAAIALEPKAFDLLVLLLSHAGELVTKQQILETVWQGSAVSDNALTRVVAQLRKAIGDDAREAKYLETVPTRGYRWIAPVRTTRSEPAQSGHKAETEGSHRERRAGTERVDNRWGRITLGFCVLAAIVVVWVWPGRGIESRPVFPRQLTVSAGVDLFPALSPDGQRLAYSSDRTGAWEIYIKPIAGGSDVALTSDGQQNVHAAWSPDGRQIAFHSMIRGGVWVIPVDGGAARQISDFGARPAWSPDGRRLAFQTDPGADIGPAARPANIPSTIWIVEAAGGQPRPLTRRGVPSGGHGAPTWSPDGRHVAFATAGFALSQIWAVDATGGEPFAIVTDTAPAYDPIYLPDGRTIVFAGTRALWGVPLDASGRRAGKATQYVPASLDGIRHISVTRDGRLAIAALKLRASLWSVPVDAAGVAAGEPQTLTNDTRTRNSRPAFSPDGTRIAVMSSVAGVLPDIWVMHADGGSPVSLTRVRDYDADPSWAPDGREVIFKSIRDGAAGLWAINVLTRAERRLADLGSAEQIVRQHGRTEEAAISPDATRIAFTVLDPRTSTKALYVRALAGGDPVRLTSGEPVAAYPVWSPDGKWIALELFEAGRTDAAVVPAAGGPLRRLTSADGHAWVHSFSPDSNRVLFAGQRDGVWNVYWVPREGGDEHRVTNNTQVGVFLRYPAWSPRGDQIVYEHGEVRGNIWLITLP